MVDPQKNRVESHSIEMDGKFFYDTVYPLIMNNVKHMAKDKLADYQEKSKEKFPNKLQKVTPMSMFQDDKAAPQNKRSREEKADPTVTDEHNKVARLVM